MLLSIFSPNSVGNLLVAVDISDLYVLVRAAPRIAIPIADPTSRAVSFTADATPCF